MGYGDQSRTETSSVEGAIGRILGRAESQNIVLVPISIAMLSVVESLPLHHRDPFDRLLAATCLAEQMTLVSADAVFDEYGVRRIW